MPIPGTPDLLLIAPDGENAYLTGPGKYASRTAQIFIQQSNIQLLAYRKKHTGFFNKLFFFDTFGEQNNCFRAGLVSFLLHIWQTKPRVVHLLCFQRICFFLMLLKPFLKFRLIYMVHGVVADEDRLKPELSMWYRWKNKMAEKAIFKSADLLLAFNQDIAIRGNTLYHSKAEIQTIKPGIDKIFFSHQHRMVNLSGKLRVLAMGGFEKREEAIINVIRSLETVKEKLQFVLIGFEHCDPLSALPGYAIETGAKGSLEEWNELLNESDIFLSAYPKETFSLATLEAMAAECAVIVHHQIKAAGCIVNGQNGFIFGGEDQPEPAGIMGQLLDSTALRYQVGHAARLAVAPMTWEAMNEKQAELYRKMLA